MQAAGRGATVATFIADLSSQDVFVIALEADQFQVGRSPVHQPLDHLATLRPTIDIVAEGNDCRRSIRLRVLNDLRYRLRKEVVAPMQIGNGVGKRHHLTSITWWQSHAPKPEPGK